LNATSYIPAGPSFEEDIESTRSDHLGNAIKYMEVEMPSRTGTQLIAEERQRLIESEGWTAEHDDTHTDCSLVRAAICYAQISLGQSSSALESSIPVAWPSSWRFSWWKPSGDRIRNLARAGALIAAEIDRLQRANENKQT
jgi:hypothetical protein